MRRLLKCVAIPNVFRVAKHEQAMLELGGILKVAVNGFDGRKQYNLLTQVFLKNILYRISLQHGNMNDSV